MNTNQITRIVLTGLAFTAGGSMAADIDVFAGLPETAADEPQILFVVDTGASFAANNSLFRCNINPTTKEVKVDGTGLAANNTPLDGTNGGVEQCALYTVLRDLDTVKRPLKIGFMFFNKAQATFDPATNTFTPTTECVGGPGGVGGCLAMRMVSISDQTTKSNVLDWIRRWDKNGGNYDINSGSNRGDGQTMQESWAYYYGKMGISGRNYASVAPVAGCGGRNIIWVGNNWNTQASPKDGTQKANSPKETLAGTSGVALKNANPVGTTEQQASITDTLTTACGASALNTAENKGAYALNWARYMKAQGITTYSIGLANPAGGCDAYYGAQMKKMGSAEVGGGEYFEAYDFTSLKIAFDTAISKIQAVNSAFAAVSLPVSVNTQGTFLNRIFIGMFRPDKNFLPQWDGNLKQYKLGEINNGADLELQDADSKRAVAVGDTGFIDACARSYWTPNVADSYWGLVPRGNCTVGTYTNPNSSNYPDGNIVEKGGQAFGLRAMTPANRVVKTCSPAFASCDSSGDTLTNFAAPGNTTTQPQLPGAANSTENDRLINWSRGLNVDDELDKGTTVIRPSAHGDVVHSRPVAVNYGTDAAPSLVVFYGGNDGLLRAVNGNRNDPADTAVGQITSAGNTYNAGAELWSFMPPEFWGKIKRLYSNTQAISYPTSIVPGTAPKDYGIDGPITALTFSGSKYIFAPMRRGGSVVYAFNVTTPATPTLQWKIGCDNNTTPVCRTGTGYDDYNQIGQTWSALKPLYTTATNTTSGAASPLLIMGGGYDACEDEDSLTANGKNHNCTSAGTKGNRVYILDALSGAIQRSFATDRAVVADATIVNYPATDTNAGKARYAYTADLGGNVYRIDLAGTDKNAWTITKIAALGCDTPAACTDSTPNRKFMFAPSVSTEDHVKFYVALGSGDREKPVKQYLGSNTIANKFFMLIDKPSDNTWLSSETSTCGSVQCTGVANLADVTTGTTAEIATRLLAKPKGWYINLAVNGNNTNEQVVTSAITIFGTVTFSTHQAAVAAANACSNNLGTTLVYNINYLTGAAAVGNSRAIDVAGDGLPPSPVAGLVKLDNGKEVPFCIGCKSNALDAGIPKSTSTFSRPKGRVYYYIQK